MFRTEFFKFESFEIKLLNIIFNVTVRKNEKLVMERSGEIDTLL